MKEETSWEEVGKWYDQITSSEGHYYHTHLIIPKLLSLLDLKKGDRLLDLGCGQGVLERALPPQIDYVGVDLSPYLIKQAEAQKRHSTSRFIKGDITQKLALKEKFSHAVFLLSLQNVKEPWQAFNIAAQHLEKGGKMVMVINHPCFRIPRQSGWDVDPHKNLQYRRIDSYLSSMEIPIQAHPGKGEKSSTTWSFHYPLSAYFLFLQKEGFVVTQLEEWVSPKKSSGKNAKREDRARKEFPLFLAIVGLR